MHVDAYSYSLTAALSTLCPVMVHVQCVPFPLRLRCDIRRACHASFISCHVQHHLLEAPGSISTLENPIKADPARK